MLAASPEDFATYLKDNWLSIAGMWCSAFRRHLLTLGNNTTNRIESFNSQVKSELRKRKGSPPSLPELVVMLLEIVQKKGTDATYKNFRNSATVVMNTLLPEMQQAGVLYNDAGFRLLQGQVVKLKSASFRLHSALQDSVAVEDVSKGKLYDLSSGFGAAMECSCTFSCTFGGLPCCHILYANQQRQRPLFEAEGIPLRWQRAQSCNATCPQEADAFNVPVADATDRSVDSSIEEDDCGMLFMNDLVMLSMWRLQFVNFVD